MMSEWTKTPMRTAAAVLAVVAALTLFYLVNPWANPTGAVQNLATWVFWVTSIALVVVLYLDRKNAPESDTVEMEGPAFARFLFNNSRAALFWLPIRLFVGFNWLEAGWHKFNDPAWTNGGSALLGYWKNAAAIPAAPGRPAITFEWYRDFLNFLISGHHEGWFALLITFGEMAVGLGILLGALTGCARGVDPAQEVLGLVPGDVLDRQVVAAEGARVGAHHGLVEALRDLDLRQPEAVADGRQARALVGVAAGLVERAAEQE